MAFTDQFVALVCPQCGGEIRINKNQYENAFVKVGGHVLYTGVNSVEDGAQCAHCGTKFARKERFMPGEGALATIAKFEGTIISIGGNFSGTMIVGDENEVETDNENSGSIISGNRNRVGKKK